MLCFVVDDGVASNIFDLYKSLGIDEEEILLRMEDFTSFLRKLQNKEVTIVEPMGRRQSSSKSLFTSQSNSQLPSSPVRRGSQVMLSPMTRKGSMSSLEMKQFIPSPEGVTPTRRRSVLGLGSIAASALTSIAHHPPPLVKEKSAKQLSTPPLERPSSRQQRKAPLPWKLGATPVVEQPKLAPVPDPVVPEPLPPSPQNDDAVEEAVASGAPQSFSCGVCSMIFKSTANLDRHLNYSVPFEISLFC